MYFILLLSFPLVYADYWNFNHSYSHDFKFTEYNWLPLNFYNFRANRRWILYSSTNNTDNTRYYIMGRTKRMLTDKGIKAVDMLTGSEVKEMTINIPTILPSGVPSCSFVMTFPMLSDRLCLYKPMCYNVSQIYMRRLPSLVDVNVVSCVGAKSDILKTRITNKVRNAILYKFNYKHFFMNTEFGNSLNVEGRLSDVFFFKPNLSAHPIRIMVNLRIFNSVLCLENLKNGRRIYEYYIVPSNVDESLIYLTEPYRGYSTIVDSDKYFDRTCSTYDYPNYLVNILNSAPYITSLVKLTRLEVEVSKLVGVIKFSAQFGALKYSTDSIVCDLDHGSDFTLMADERIVVHAPSDDCSELYYVKNFYICLDPYNDPSRHVCPSVYAYKKFKYPKYGELSNMKCANTEHHAYAWMETMHSFVMSVITYVIEKCIYIFFDLISKILKSFSSSIYRIFTPEFERVLFDTDTKYIFIEYILLYMYFTRILNSKLNAMIITSLFIILIGVKRKFGISILNLTVSAFKLIFVK